MSATADIPVEDGVAHIALDAGPGARLSADILRRIDAGLTAAEADPAAEIVILAGKSGGFPSGLTEPPAGGDDADNHLSALCSRIEDFPKPVVAVLTGAVVGGGAELGLAAQYRLVHKDARLGFPHIRLGLVPSAGATQRLPRLVGAEAALDILLGGQLMPFDMPATAALADRIFEGGRYEAIRAFAETLRAEDVRPAAQNRAGFADGQAYQAAVNAARARLDPKRDVAAAQIVAAVEAALLLPIEAGLAFEQAAAEDCLDTAQSKALAHIFHAEQAVSAHTRRNDLTAIGAIAVLGPGALASQIVMAALDSGLRVNWLIRDAAHRQDAVAHVQGLLREGVSKGRMDADRAARCLGALHHGDGPQMLDDVDIALRAARGQRGISPPPDLPLAHCLTGTDPGLAMRFAPLGNATRLVEVILGPEGSETELRAALGLARRLNALAVVERTSGPSLHDRLAQALLRGADALVDLGQSPYAIDAALRDWGMALPPYELADHLGLDTVARQDRAEAARNWSSVVTAQERSGGHGFYRYSLEGPATPSPDILPHINGMRRPEADMPPARIVKLLFGAMANEGARALREGVVPLSSEIDIVSVLTGLVPRWSGGVMHLTCAEGLLQVTRAMTALPHPDRDFWTPEAVFAELIKYGRGFDTR